MTEPHIYEENGVKWNRIFCLPQALIDNKWDEDSPQDFVRKTGSKKGTYGDILDKSKELSIKREEKYGRDDVKEKMYSDYEKKRGKGFEHPQKKKERIEKMKKEGIKLKFKK